MVGGVRRTVGILLGAILLAARVAAAEEKTSPTIAREAAESNAKTPAGRRYQSALESSLTWLARAIERCGKGVAKEEAVSFDVLVEIGDNGKAEDVLLSPETSVGRCARDDFQDATYPYPPRTHWWVKIPVELK
jgi:hypothetical protein